MRFKLQIKQVKISIQNQKMQNKNHTKLKQTQQNKTQISLVIQRKNKSFLQISIKNRSFEIKFG